MANKKISDLTAASSVADTDVFVIENTNGTYKVTADKVKSTGGVSSVNSKTGAVVLYGTDINMSTDTSLPTVTEQISSNKTNIGDLATQLGGKQDTLTAGTGIAIDSDTSTISSKVSFSLSGTELTITNQA